MAGLDSSRIRSLFDEAATLLVDGPGRDALRPRSSQVNAALTEALFVGLMGRREGGDQPSPDVVSDAVRRLNRNPELLDATVKATADEESVRARLRIATAEFAEA